MADRTCGCGAGEACIACTPVEVLTESFTDAVLAEIRAAEARHGC